MHKSVGAIIRNDKDEILLLDRVNVPLGWACPAGHVDKGESPEEAMIREVKEETNLEVLEYKLLANKFLENNVCKQGVKGHDFTVFEVIEWSGDLKKEDKEANAIKWVDVNDLKNFNLEEAWGYWFKKLGII